MALSRSASPPLPVSVGVQTHRGKVRSENQDRISSARTPFGDLYLLADGVGGLAGGAEAAQFVVDAFVQQLARAEEKNAVEALKRAALEINSNLKRMSGTPDSVPGMSSTVVLALVQGRHVVIGHAGDSRAYLIRGRHMEQLTHDHSLVERLISENYIRREDARSHPDANVLTQALGQTADIELETLEFDLSPGDAILLCSDGLWAYSTPGEMEAVVSAPSLSPQAAAEALLNIALNNGGGDNVSLQFLRFGTSVETMAVPASALHGKANKRAALLAGGAVVLVAIGWISFYNLRYPIGSAAQSNKSAVASSPASASKNAQPAGSGQIPGAQLVPSGPSNSARGAPHATAAVVSFPHAKLAPWQERMKALETVEVSETTEDLCAFLIRPQAKLYYTADGEKEARRIQRTVNAPEAALAEATSDQMSSCTNAHVVAVPPAVASVVQRATDIEHEIEKHSPINGVPSLPSQLPIPRP